MEFELIKEYAVRVTKENYHLIFPNGVSYVGYFKGVDTPENLKNNHWAFVLSNKTECIINGNLILSIH